MDGPKLLMRDPLGELWVHSYFQLNHVWYNPQQKPTFVKPHREENTSSRYNSIVYPWKKEKFIKQNIYIEIENIDTFM